MTIGLVAKQAGMGVETVRFYERAGLVDKPGRTTGGFRKYGPDTVRRLKFIRRAKALGFTLREIQELLALSLRPDADCDDVRHRTQQKLNDIELRIRHLEQMRTTLTDLVEACARATPGRDCVILDAFDMDASGACCSSS